MSLQALRSVSKLVPILGRQAPNQANYPPLVLASSPVGYWKLNEASGNAADSSGGGRSMVATGGLTYQDIVDSITSIRLNGTTGYFAAADAAAFSPEIGASGVITLEAWVYPRARALSMMILSKGHNTGGGVYEYVMYINTDGTLYANTSVLVGGAEVMGATSVGVIPLNTWTHVAMTYNRATPSLKLYIDGVLDGVDTTASGTAGDGTAQLEIGHRQDGGGSFFNGNLAHLAVYNSELSQAVIQTHAAYTP